MNTMTYNNIYNTCIEKKQKYLMRISKEKEGESQVQTKNTKDSLTHVLDENTYSLKCKLT